MSLYIISGLKKLRKELEIDVRGDGLATLKPSNGRYGTPSKIFLAFNCFERIINALVLRPKPSSSQRIISHTVNERYITTI